MKMIWVRLARPDDISQLNEWIQNGDRNYFDPDCMTYATTTMLLAHNDKSVVAMPVQTVLMLESLAVNPAATNHEVAVGLREIVSNLVLQAQQRGIGELYFLGTNEDTNQFAKRHEFTELPWKVHRLKIPRLGENNENIPQGDN